MGMEKTGDAADFPRDYLRGIVATIFTQAGVPGLMRERPFCATHDLCTPAMHAGSPKKECSGRTSVAK